MNRIISPKSASRSSLVSAIAMAFAIAAPPALAASPRVLAVPLIGQYGEELSVDVGNNDMPLHLPGTRYTISGNTITVDYDYSANLWNAGTPAFVSDLPVDVGELAPGNYTVTARLHNMDDTAAPVQVATSNLPVVPPSAMGVYSVPQYPDAYAATQVMVRSPFLYDPTSMKATVSGNVIRVDFNFYGDAPIGGAAPAGSTSYGSVQVAGLAPGSYQLQAFGTSTTGGLSQLSFTRDVAVGTTTPVVEYYAAATHHYFMSAGPTDIALLDPGTQGWQRSGQEFDAWLNASDAPAGAMPVCRFYAAGPNSHFYTGDPNECADLKSLEQQQRAQAAAQGQPFLGWQFEQIAFYALVPVNGQCAAGTWPVYRVYNQRAQFDDSNHRYTSDPQMRAAALAEGWADEGVVFCTPY